MPRGRQGNEGPSGRDSGRRGPVPVGRIPRKRRVAQRGDLRERIARRAYELFETRGCRHGHHEEDWLQAEQEVMEGVEGQRGVEGEEEGERVRESQGEPAME